MESARIKNTAFAASVLLACAFTFSCSSDGDDGDTVTYNGRTYKTVRIGGQTWMAENLNYDAPGSRCYGKDGLVSIWNGNDPYNYDSYDRILLSDAQVQANCEKYGRLYDWATAMALPEECNRGCYSQIQKPRHNGICPSGWHIPSDSEWDELIDFVESGSDCSYCAGTILKARSGWDDYEGASGNGTDNYGFSALPGGRAYVANDQGSVGLNPDGSRYYEEFRSAGNYGNWWSASADRNFPYKAYHHQMYGGGSVNGGMRNGDSSDKPFLLSVRCVRD